MDIHSAFYITHHHVLPLRGTRYKFCATGVIGPDANMRKPFYARANPTRASVAKLKPTTIALIRVVRVISE